MERASWTHTAFTPINILSQLNNIGGNLERGQQEDAHEFMRSLSHYLLLVFINFSFHPLYNFRDIFAI